MSDEFMWSQLITRSRDAIVSLLSGRLSAHSARFWQFSVKQIASSLTISSVNY